MAIENGNMYHATDEELDADLKEEYKAIESRMKPQLEFPLASALLVDGAPIVGRDKEAKLQAAIKRVFDTRGFTVSDMHMPIDAATEQSKGVLFVILKDPASAQSAASTLDGHALDKRHTLGVRTFDEVERLQSEVEETFHEPEMAEYTDREYMRSWLADPNGRDQVALLRGDDLSVSWVGRHGQLVGCGDKAERKKWTESYTQWSPQGTYIATVHTQGIVLWGGNGFDRVNRFIHAEATLIDFSPNERYLVTWSKKPIDIPPGALKNPNFPFTEEDEGNHVCIWEIVSGKLMRSFPMVIPPSIPGMPASEEEKRKVAFTWPMFKWSGDEKYLARVTPHQQISVYETPSFGMLAKKSVKIDGVVDFDWCPLGDKEREADAEREAAIEAGGKVGPERENVLAYWVPEIGNQPARVTLLSLPSRTVLRSKNLVNVSDCKIHWQSSGDFLCVKVDRHTKTKKTLFSNLELFRVREKGLPVETIEIKDTVIAFAWEPKGDKFVLITTNDPTASAVGPGSTFKTNISFYQLDTRKGDFRVLKTVDGKNCNAIFWSPKGRHCVTATLGSSSKFDIDWWDTEIEQRQQDSGNAQSSSDPSNSVQLLASADHYGMTACEWDPSGRYIILAGTIWQTSMEAGYAVYSFAGAQLFKTTLDRLKQMLWRPRPATLLSKADQKRIRRNLREYGRAFEEADAAEESNVSAELLEHRQRLIDEWNAWRSRVKASLDEERKDTGRELPKRFVQIGKQKQDDVETVEEWQEEVVEEKEEVVEEETGKAS